MNVQVIIERILICSCCTHVALFCIILLIAFDVQCRKNASKYGFESRLYGTCRGWVDGSWDAHLASPADFFGGADDITKRESLGSRLAW